MPASAIPVYDICSLSAESSSTSNDFMADRFAHYLHGHTHLRFPHKHSFYHLVYFTKGSGSHSIDFVNFPVQAGQLYCMVPGQVHTWSFKNKPEGFIINFSESFIQQLILNTRYLDQFSFLSGVAAQQVINIPVAKRSALVALFETILAEQASTEEHAGDFVRTALLQLLFTINRTIKKDVNNPANNYNSLLFKNFQQLVDQHYASKKLTKEYAALLYITPNHLNALSNDVGGRPAGEIIRDRVLLEAKRLLINADLTIAAIAARLDFEDNSYFSRFFKKYEGITPQEFRRQTIKN